MILRYNPRASFGIRQSGRTPTNRPSSRAATTAMLRRGNASIAAKCHAGCEKAVVNDSPINDSHSWVKAWIPSIPEESCNETIRGEDPGCVTPSASLTSYYTVGGMVAEHESGLLRPGRRAVMKGVCRRWNQDPYPRPSASIGGQNA